MDTDQESERAEAKGELYTDLLHGSHGGEWDDNAK